MLDDARRPVDMSDEQLEDTVVTSDEQPRDMLIRYMKATSDKQLACIYHIRWEMLSQRTYGHCQKTTWQFIMS